MTLYICIRVPLPEKTLIAEIRRMVTSRRKRGSNLITGIGDDCAVLRFASEETLVTTDFSLEGVHFRRDWHSAESVGHRCLARGLSDIAAMGGAPVAVFLSLALPRDVPQTWVRGFVRGLVGLAEKFGVALAGGDTAESPNGIVADIIVVGSVPEGKAVLRSGARAGDRIFVSGELGGSAAAVAEMQAKPKRKLNPKSYARHFYPEPRIALGRVLRERGRASSMIDLSDGLSTDLAHICEESGVGAEIESRAIPLAHVGRPVSEVKLEVALHGGEDYELLFTAPRGKRVPAQIGGVMLTQIGVITRSSGVFLVNENGVGSELKARGWEHFR
jgi:thiamine-monophosphate kinase